jgi:hypothetical protein
LARTKTLHATPEGSPSISSPVFDETLRALQAGEDVALTARREARARRTVN